MNNNNHSFCDKEQLPNSNLKEMCIISKKEMCHIDYNAPAYLAEQEELKKKQLLSENPITESDNPGVPIASEVISKATFTNTEMPQLPLNAVQAKLPNSVSRKTLFDSDISVNEAPQPTAYNIMRRFIQQISVRTCNGRIYIYNGRYYANSCTDDVRSLILQLFRDEIKDNSPSFVSNVVEYLKIEPEVRVDDSCIRTDIVSFENGILQLRNGNLLPHNSSLFVTYSIRSNYVPNSNCPTPYWDNYTLKLTGGDPALLERIYQMMGYILTLDRNGKCIFLLQGIGNSGKSVLTRFLEKLFSHGAFYPIHSDKLKTQFAVSELFGRALCVCQDMPNEALDMKAISILKSISGNDAISSDVKFKSAITFTCKAAIVLTTNFAVVAKSRDDAFYSRLVSIPCRYAVPKSEQDPNLLERLLIEREGIIQKSLLAYFRLVQNGYVFAGDYPPNAVFDSNDFSEDIAMNIYNFVVTSFEKDVNSFVFTDDVYEHYVSKNIYIARNRFSEIFKKVSFEVFEASDARKYKQYVDENGNECKSKNALRCVLGIRFKDNAF